MKTFAIVLASGLAFAVPAFADSVTTTTTQSGGGAVVVTPPAVSPPSVAVAPSASQTYESSKTTDDGDRQVDKKTEKVETPYGTSTTKSKTVHEDDD